MCSEVSLFQSSFAIEDHNDFLFATVDELLHNVLQLSRRVMFDWQLSVNYLAIAFYFPWNLHLAHEVAHQWDPYCYGAACPHIWRTTWLDTLGAHLLTVWGDEGSCAALQQLWEICGQTLLDGESEVHIWMQSLVLRWWSALWCCPDFIESQGSGNKDGLWVGGGMGCHVHWQLRSVRLTTGKASFTAWWTGSLGVSCSWEWG